ncbi:hypothetical protein [Phaeovulum sp. W22_SRMD_FR3]|uniref:hypothetical protein n=1 Tax=Phaeovulum sp. W22_SRMD_FR3 TaxID=3240274 RepID=UPI003F9E2695
MRSKTALLPATIGGIGLFVLAFGAAQVFGPDYALVLFDRKQPSAQLQQMQSAPPALPGSGRSRKALLDDCSTLLPSIYLSLFPASLQEKIYQDCAGYAATTLADTPTSGQAWAVTALIAAARNQTAEFERAYVLSQRASPAEGWISERRFAILANTPQSVTPPITASFTEDVKVLLAAPDTRKMVATAYNRLPNLRPAITDAVSQATDVAQRAFLNEVKKTGPMIQ